MTKADSHGETKVSLKAELDLLRWHKLANESAIKASILKDRQTRKRATSPTSSGKSLGKIDVAEAKPRSAEKACET